MTCRVGKPPANMDEARLWRRHPVYRRFRARLMQKEPLCRHCAAIGKTKAAQELDHIQPLRHGNLKMFWDTSNLQPLCTACHKLKSDAEAIKPRKRDPQADEFDRLADVYS